MKFIYSFYDIDSHSYCKEIHSDVNIINEILDNDTEIEFEEKTCKVECASDATINLNKDTIAYTIEITEK